MERRLPIIVVVRLVYCWGVGSDAEERTYTDNISPTGARIFSKCLWRPGDMIWVAPVHEEPVCANVIYSQRLLDDRYSLGVRFEDGFVTWSIIQRYARS